MKKQFEAVRKTLEWLDAPDDPKVPAYDPVHLGETLILFLVAMGALYWLLWTLLVFEGGIFPKIFALLRVIFTSKTLADYGYKGQPYAMGVFEGWLGNLTAAILCAGAVYVLYRLYQRAARRHR